MQQLMNSEFLARVQLYYTVSVIFRSVCSGVELFDEFQLARIFPSSRIMAFMHYGIFGIMMKLQTMMKNHYPMDPTLRASYRRRCRLARAGGRGARARAVRGG